MKKNLYPFVYLLVFLLTMVSCKKSSEDQQPSQPTQTTVTSDNYALITINMSYTQVVNILGKPTTTSGNNYTWSADNSNTITIYLVIVNGVVQSKSQTGLYVVPSGGGTTSGGCPGTYNGHTVYVGPKGGCYYINSNGNKTYI